MPTAIGIYQIPTMQQDAHIQIHEDDHEVEVKNPNTGESTRVSLFEHQDENLLDVFGDDVYGVPDANTDAAPYLSAKIHVRSDLGRMYVECAETGEEATLSPYPDECGDLANVLGEEVAEVTDAMLGLE